MYNIISSSIEAKLGGLFEHFQNETSLQTALEEMVHTQPQNPVTIDKYVANIIVNEMSKQKGSISIYTKFYLVCDKVRQNHFHILWD